MGEPGSFLFLLERFNDFRGGGPLQIDGGCFGRMLLEAGNVIFGEIHFQRIGEGPAAIILPGDRNQGVAEVITI
jgi:hypothetical protein